MKANIKKKYYDLKKIPSELLREQRGIILNYELIQLFNQNHFFSFGEFARV